LFDECLFLSARQARRVYVETPGLPQDEELLKQPDHNKTDE
jgi:hypothetical protein